MKPKAQSNNKIQFPLSYLIFVCTITPFDRAEGDPSKLTSPNECTPRPRNIRYSIVDYKTLALIDIVFHRVHSKWREYVFSPTYVGPLVPLLHILKWRSFFIKTHLRRALVPFFHTSDKPIAFKLTSFIEIHFLRRDTPPRRNTPPP